MAWTMGTFFVLCIAFACFVARYWAQKHSEALAHLRQLQESRSPLAADELAHPCLAGVSADVAERVRKVVAAVSELSLSPPPTKVDPSRLRVDDALCDDLGFYFDSLAILHLLLELEKEFGVRMAFRETVQRPTVRDVMCLVMDALKNQEPK